MVHAKPYLINCRIWIDSESGTFLGEGRIELLKNIEITGSLSKAAKQMNMSYKKAWNLVSSMNKQFREPLVICSVGGTCGGGSVLTEAGKKIITLFTELNQKNVCFLEHELNNIDFLK